MWLSLVSYWNSRSTGRKPHRGPSRVRHSRADHLSTGDSSFPFYACNQANLAFTFMLVDDEFRVLVFGRAGEQARDHNSFQFWLIWCSLAVSRSQSQNGNVLGFLWSQQCNSFLLAFPPSALSLLSSPLTRAVRKANFQCTRKSGECSALLHAARWWSRKKFRGVSVARKSMLSCRRWGAQSCKLEKNDWAELNSSLISAELKSTVIFLARKSQKMLSRI